MGEQWVACESHNKGWQQVFVFANLHPVRIGSLGAGALTNMGTDGWRWIFWLQAIFHGLTSLGLFFFYWPPKNIEYPNMSFKDYVWACDPIGSLLFISGATLTLLAMDWAGGAYGWSNPHVVAPLTLGLLLLVGFGIYGKPLSQDVLWAVRV